MFQEMDQFAVLQLSGCAGCEVSLLNADAWVDQYKLVYMPLVISAYGVPDVDVLLVSGGVRTDEDLYNLRLAVRRADQVVAVGTCAISGGAASWPSSAVQAYRGGTRCTPARSIRRRPPAAQNVGEPASHRHPNRGGGEPGDRSAYTRCVVHAAKLAGFSPWANLPGWLQYPVQHIYSLLCRLLFLPERFDEALG
jgi:hypothetical protein